MKLDINYHLHTHKFLDGLLKKSIYGHPIKL